MSGWMLWSGEEGSYGGGVAGTLTDIDPVRYQGLKEELCTH
jgi:hypothetical protein